MLSDVYSCRLPCEGRPEPSAAQGSPTVGTAAGARLGVTTGGCWSQPPLACVAGRDPRLPPQTGFDGAARPQPRSATGGRGMAMATATGSGSRLPRQRRRGAGRDRPPGGLFGFTHGLSAGANPALETPGVRQSPAAWLCHTGHCWHHRGPLLLLLLLRRQQNARGGRSEAERQRRSRASSLPQHRARAAPRSLPLMTRASERLCQGHAATSPPQ